MSEWKNRIVGEDMVDPGQLLANPMNWRVHPKAQQKALTGILKEVGWVQRVIVNVNTGHVVDGHARVSLALKQNATQVPVLYVDLSEAEERLVLATLDPISAMATSDKDLLTSLLADIKTNDEALGELLNDVASDANILQRDETYTEVVESPIYEVRGERLPVPTLYDRTKADTLIRAIDASGAPDDIARFLRAAAERHVIFRYDRVAEFYAHATADIQELMEQSALVIIDFNQAIERGFVQLNKDIQQVFTKDYPDA